MNATKRRVGSRPGLVDAANVLTTAVRASMASAFMTTPGVGSLRPSLVMSAASQVSS